MKPHKKVTEEIVFMEENSRKKPKLSHDNFVPESESRPSLNTDERSESMPGPSTSSGYGSRVELLIRERLLERMLQKQNTYNTDAVAAHPSHGEKRRCVDDEPPSTESVKPKRIKHTSTIILDNKVLRDCTIVVKADTIDNLTSDRKVLPIIYTNEEEQRRGEKRKPAFDHYAGKGIKKLKVSHKYEHQSEHKQNATHTEVQSTSTDIEGVAVTIGLTKEDTQCNECPISCVCKVGPSPLPRPTVRHGYPQLTPLYKKLLQRRLLNPANVVFNKCCARQCSQVWCRGRFSRAHLEAGYDPSDLRVDMYKWGQWKQKAGEEKTDTGDDWFW